MKSLEKILDELRVPAGKRIKLSDYDPAWAGDKNRPKKERKALAQKLLSEDVSELAEAQQLLYAADTWSVLLIFQAMDAAGKDSTIKHVMSGVNPQGCQVYSFKHPSAEDLDHTYLWRCMKALPERGRIGIFNRSYYEEVLIVRVHPELLESQRIPGRPAEKQLWKARYAEINEFERHLVHNGTLVLKFFLNVSREEQRQRFLDRLNEPDKLWKFSASDVRERSYWDDYMQAYEQMLNGTSSEWAPWYVVPADHKWVARAAVAAIVTRAIAGLKLQYPQIDAEQRSALAEAKKQLEAEAC